MRVTALCGISGSVLMLAFLSGQPAKGLPQAISGGDFLAVLLGDAKTEISSVFVREADSYFHGGIDVDCHALAAGGRAACEQHHHDAGCSCSHHGCSHEEENAHDTAGDEDHGAFDPWRWINSHVRAPEIERHLDGSKTVEMMPWFWAAVKADPHNVEAWGTAWYVASHMMKDDRLALKIAEEGWRLNPSSIDMACTLGRACRAKDTLDAGRAEGMFKTAFEMGLRKGEMSEKEQFALVESVTYLTDYAKKRRDRNALIEIRDRVGSLLNSHPAMKSLKDAIDSL